MFFPAIKDSYFKMRQHFVQADTATGDVLQKKVCNFIKKETLAQVFPCEFCEISKNTFFHRTPSVAASVQENLLYKSKSKSISFLKMQGTYKL